MTTPEKCKPMTRGKLAKFLSTSTKTLKRFIEKEGIEVEPRALLRPHLVALIINRFYGEQRIE
jgi:hypothetical protein